MCVCGGGGGGGEGGSETTSSCIIVYIVGVIRYYSAVSSVKGCNESAK